MKTYYVDVSPYPLTYIITAHSAEDAKQQARDKFVEDAGVSVYETVITSEEEIRSFAI